MKNEIIACVYLLIIFTETKDEVEELIKKGPRVKFPTATLRKENTDISSNEKENDSTVNKKVYIYI